MVDNEMDNNEVSKEIELKSIEKKSNRFGKKGSLENLPQDIKADMEKHMKEVSAYSCQAYMSHKYGETFPILKTLTKNAYQSYQRKHRERMNKQIELQNMIATPPAEMLNVINSFTSVEISLADKQKALADLFNICQARRQLLELKNNNFIDPMIEALILQNAKEQRVIIEKIAILGEQLAKDAEKDYIAELASFYQVVIACVSNVYRMMHGDNKYQEFLSHLDTQMEAKLKQYSTEKAIISNKKI